MTVVRVLAGALCALSLAPALARAEPDPQTGMAAAPGNRPREAKSARDVQGRGAQEAALANEASLDTLEALLLARHPALAEADARARGSRALASETTSLAPPELVYQQWAVPLQRPHDLSRANMIMLGARVPLDSPAVRRAEVRAARSRADASGYEREQVQNQLLAELRRDYAEYVRARAELALHSEHVALVNDLFELATAAYASNQASASAVHDTRVTLGRLHGDIAMIEADLARARVRLNLTSGRAADAPLGPPREARWSASPEPSRARPELSMQAKRIEAQRDELAARRLAARRPSWMVGVDYMAMPADGQPWGYGAMVSMSLPWLSQGLRAAAERARHELAQEQAALSVQALSVRMQVEEARVSLAAAERTCALVEREWLAHAREAYEIERETWAAGRSEARMVLERLDALLEARVSLVRARRDVNVRQVELAWALGSTQQLRAGSTP